ncbi:protein kinase [Aliikangiella sp. G2MR2-5]|uniref:serine/threonine protein kinase n=1 Tax=Aliikangiella sp. G2MR2-5 TaxID=2788943 RepID=UPI0018AAC013|nr:protein kinase [Aliikangiella sp. G2MR2-5]
MMTTQQQYKLIENTSFTKQSDGKVHVRCQRENHVVNFMVNENIMEFMQAFSAYQTVAQVASKLEGKGFNSEQVVSFSEKVFSSPLSHCFKQGLHYTHPKKILTRFGFKLKDVFRNSRLVAVVSAVDSNNEEVVLRVVKAPRDDKNFARQESRLNFEYQLLSELREIENVIDAYKLEDDSYVALAYKYINGTSLKDFVNRRHTIKQRVELALEIVRTFRAIHEKGFLHGDIHPSNILIDDSGKPTVIDFDCAYKIGGPVADRIGGVPHFFPPENTNESWFDQSKSIPISYYGELYQIGLVVYYCLTGKLLFDKPGYSELMEAISNNSFEVFNQTPEGEYIEENILEFIKQCVSKSPEKRELACNKLDEALAEMLGVNYKNYLNECRVELT